MFLYSSHSTCTCFHPAWVFLYLSLARSYLFIHIGLLMFSPDIIFGGMHPSWAWKVWWLNINHLSWAPLPSRSSLCGIFLSRSLKSPKYALLTSRVMNLIFTLLLAFWILDSTISWALKSRLPVTIISATSHSSVSMRCSRTPLLLGSSITWRKKLSPMHPTTSCTAYALLNCSSSMAEVHQEDRGLWIWGCSNLSVEGLIHLFFLVRWTITDTHYNVTFACPLFIPKS